MEVTKKELLGYPQYVGDEEFLRFGAALHEVFLQADRNRSYKMLDADSKAKVEAMVKRLNDNPIVTSLMTNSTREHKFSIRLNKVKTVVILDAKQPMLRRGFDLKTTNATSQRDFEEKIRTLGYVRQGLTYKLAAGLKYFYFVGINKTKPYPIFIADIDSKQFKDDYRYAENELKFLLYFYRFYGKTIARKQAA
jgi:hypothetical protein